MSQVNTIYKNMQDAREQVMTLCGLSDETLNELQWEAALECLKKVLRSDEYGITQLTKSQDFWLWWRDQWFRRDDKFINSLQWNLELMVHTCQRLDVDVRECLRTQADFQNMYYHYHNISTENPLVNNRILEVSFYQMITTIANQNHK